MKKMYWYKCHIFHERIDKSAILINVWDFSKDGDEWINPYLLHDDDEKKEEIMGEKFLQEQKKQYEEINHPKRYIKGGMECFDAIKAAVSNLDGWEGCLVGNIIKYVWRFKDKNGVEDLKKARVYLDRLIEDEEKNQDAMLQR